MLEFALGLPVLLALFVGLWAGAEAITTKDTVTQALRNSVRTATLLGAAHWTSGSSTSGCQSTNNDPCIVDAQIIGSLLATMSTVKEKVTISEIDIYQPDACGQPTPPCNDNGSYQSSEALDQYSGTGTLQGSAAYTLDKRVSLHPNEPLIGVQVKYTFTSSTVALFTMTLTQWSVMQVEATG